MAGRSVSKTHNEDEFTSLAPSEYMSFVLSACNELKNAVGSGNNLTLDGYSLNLSDVIAVSRNGLSLSVTDDQKTLDQMVASVDLLNKRLAEGKIVYGVNTGVGGNADTRTNVYDVLQKALIQHHHSAVLTPLHQGRPGSYILDNLSQHCIPIPIVKAAMLARCNSLIRGHSAVRVQLVHNIVALINQDFTPVVPLRGSISASGDLNPLSYIAGTLEGNPDIFVHGGPRRNNEIITADKALQEAGLEPLAFGPKEALGLLNGTAFSTGAASLVLFEANQLVLLSLVVTAMCTEALLGTRRNYHPFISNIRPHPGQKDAAESMYRFLVDSKLATNQHPELTGLAQDRYALRTASQWIGPHIENMTLATNQVACELNSTTDNPLFDSSEQTIHHGGNFQASSITTAMEKTSSAMQAIGKIIFSQCSEIINPMLNKGLTPNLCADDPSLSYALKGVDVNMASYMSELCYLNNPISNCVQTADVNNQPVNSLALIASRYAGDSVEVLSLMMASHIYVLCQALDLRALYMQFVKATSLEIAKATALHFSSFIPSSKKGFSVFQDAIWKELMTHWNQHATLDLSDRAEKSVTLAAGELFKLLNANQESKNGNGPTDGLDQTQPNIAAAVRKWQTQVTSLLVEKYDETRKEFFCEQTTTAYLSTTTGKLYSFVRDHLGVPMHKGLRDHPTYEDGSGGAGKKTIGSHIATIYNSLREGGFAETLADCWGTRDVGNHPTSKRRTTEIREESMSTSQVETEDDLSSAKRTNKRRRVSRR